MSEICASVVFLNSAMHHKSIVTNAAWAWLCDTSSGDTRLIVRCLVSGHAVLARVINGAMMAEGRKNMSPRPTHISVRGDGLSDGRQTGRVHVRQTTDATADQAQRADRENILRASLTT